MKSIRLMICVLVSLFCLNTCLGEKHGARNQSETDNAPSEVCQRMPKIDIIKSENDTEIISLNPNIPIVVFAPKSEHVLVECVSTSPIEWIFDGPYRPSISSIEVITKGANSTTESPKCFIIQVRLETTKTSTGKYWCKTIDENYSSSWYLYGNGNSLASLLYQDRKFNMVSNGIDPLVLPCQVANPNVTVLLTKDDKVLGVDNKSVKYDPRIGFTIDSSQIPNPNGTYKCSAFNSTHDQNAVVFNVRLQDSMIVLFHKTVSLIVNNELVTLTCEGNHSWLNDVPDIMNETDGRFTFPKEIMNFTGIQNRAKYEFTAATSGNRNSQARCEELGTSKIWNLRLFGEPGISYDISTKRFVCHSRTDYTPVLMLEQCGHPLECLLVDKCLTWNQPFTWATATTRTNDDDCKITLLGTSPCPSQSQQTGLNTIEPNPLNTGCASLENPGYSGIVRCNVAELGWTSVMYYFIGLKSGEVITDWQQVSTEDLAELVNVEIGSENMDGRDNKTVYEQESVQFTCKATKFLFSIGFRWRFRMSDGSLVKPKREKTVNNHRSDTYAQTRNLIIGSTDVVEVVCFVYFWNSTEWFIVSKALNVSKSLEPKILFPLEDKPLSLETGTNESVVCRAEGIPPPDLQWYRNGKVFKESSILYFGHVDIDDEGEYQCVATNLRGRVTRNVTVSVNLNQSTMYIGLGSAFLLISCFIAIFTVMWRKLKSNQGIMLAQDQKEYVLFRFGDAKAIKNAANGYIVAECLPYNKEYEIPKEDLVIDKENKLGSGSFGIVYEGTFAQQTGEKIKVAVKTNLTNNRKHLKALQREIKILTYIGYHDNIISLLGAVTKNVRKGEVFAVVEYCPLGSLVDYLQANKLLFLNQIVDDDIYVNVTFNTSSATEYQPKEFTISTTNLITWSYEIANGMEYLASKKIFHGDLAGRNILLNADRSIKIADFGISRQLSNDFPSYICLPSEYIPWRYLAPEILQHRIFSTSSDVWAFSITLWEIFTLGETPYAGMSLNYAFQSKLVFDGFRMEKPKFANSCVWNAIQQCWGTTPAERPGFSELKGYFHWLLHHWDDPRGLPKLTNKVEVSKPTKDLQSHDY